MPSRAYTASSPRSSSPPRFDAARPVTIPSMAANIGGATLSTLAAAFSITSPLRFQKALGTAATPPYGAAAAGSAGTLRDYASLTPISHSPAAQPPPAMPVSDAAYHAALRSLSSRGRQVSPVRQYSRSPGLQYPILPPEAPELPSEPTPQPPPPRTATREPEPEPEPEAEPAVEDASGVKAEIARRLQEIRAALAEHRGAIRSAVSAMESLEAEREVLEKRLLGLVPAGAEEPCVPEACVAEGAAGWAAEKESLEEALRTSEGEVAAMRQREETFDETLNAMRLQLEQAMAALVEERRRAAELGDRLDESMKQPVRPPPGHAVVGLELGEGAQHSLDGVWIASVIENGPAFRAGLLLLRLTTSGTGWAAQPWGAVPTSEGGRAEVRRSPLQEQHREHRGAPLPCRLSLMGAHLCGVHPRTHRR